jgi:hypothetical protein
MMTDKLITQVDPAWQQAMNDLADEKHELLAMLDNITTLWEMEAPLEDLENAMVRAKKLMNKFETDTEV